MTLAQSERQKTAAVSFYASLLIAVPWGILITQSRHHWGGESYYNFGWFVPFMAIWLLWKNLSALAAPAGPGITIRPSHLLLATAGMLLTLPFHALSEVNPFWRLPLWIQAGGISVYCLAIAHAAFGWKGVRASLFPLLFVSTMVPWPYRMEVMIVQSLTGFVVELAMIGLHFIGYPVELAGNSFVLGELTIGVNEACSGIRSLQALFMVTLFLGSLFGQGWLRRLAAILILPVVVIVVNTGRALFLAVQVIENGHEAYNEWHDPAGYIAFGVSMVLIYSFIELFNIGSHREKGTQPLSLKEVLSCIEKPLQPARLLCMLMIPLSMFAAVEGWFRYHELRASSGLEWELALPGESDPSVNYLQISPKVEELLGYSFGYRFQEDISRIKWADIYYYGYTEDNKFSSVSSYGHSPTICMQASGATMEEQYPDLRISIPDGPTLALKHYLFVLRDSDTRLHIFWTVWERRNMSIDPELLQSLDYKTQWLQLLRGRRDFSRKVLLVSLAGMDDAAEAKADLSKLLDAYLRKKPD